MSHSILDKKRRAVIILIILKQFLRELAEIRAGLHFRGKVEHDPAGNVALVQIKDLDDELRFGGGELSRVHIEKPDLYLLMRGDVLFVSRGARLGAAEISEELEGSIATGSFFVLRPKPESRVLPAYLAWAINAPNVQAQLRRMGQGSNVQMLRRADLEELALDVPPLEIQRAIVALEEVARTERRLMNELCDKRSTLAQAVASRAVSSIARNPN